MASLRPLFEYLGQKIDGLSSRVSLGGKMRILLLLVLIVIGGGGLAMLATDNIDADPDFAASDTIKGGSHAVAVAAALIDREVNIHHWAGNDPFFMPGHWLDNMPNYQQGIIYGLSRFTFQLSDQLGRARGSSQVDPDLDRASGLLKYPGNIWVFDPKTSLVPTAPSEAQYRRAREALLSYNQRLAEGRAVFDPRADNLMTALDSIAADLGSQSAVIEDNLHERRFWLTETHSDDIFYATKGRLYAYYLVLRELGKDYAEVIKQRDLTSVWNNMLTSFHDAIALQPLVIVSAAPDSQFLPSHLASQGFFVLRARTNLREIASILAK